MAAWVAWIGGLALAAVPPGPGPHVITDSAGDVVTLKDGQKALGQVVEPAPRGKVVLIIRRAWAAAHVPDWLKRWETAEAAWVPRARRERRDRLIAWRKERVGAPDGGDPIRDWIDREIDRLADAQGNAAAERPNGDRAAEPVDSPLMAVQLTRGDVRSTRRRPADVGRLLRQGWRAGFEDVESMPLDDLKAALQGKGFALQGDDPVGLEDLLPIMPEPPAKWQARRAATEVRRDPDLRFIRYQGLVLPEGRDGTPGGLPAVLGMVKNLLGDQPADDPLAARLRAVAARGRAGLVVTRLELAPDLASVSVETVLWVRLETDRWAPMVKRSATVRPDAIGPDAGKNLEGDPQVKAAFNLVDALGLGPVPDDLRRRSLNLGAATQRALGQAREALDRDLDSLALPVGRPTAANAEPVRDSTG